MEKTELVLSNIGKTFPGVVALDDVNLIVEKGEVHCLCGENGAGKSTLIKILSGVYQYGSYEGTFFLQGKECRFNGTSDSKAAGIACVYQELSLFPELSISENVFAGNLPNHHGVVNWNEVYSKTQQYLDILELSIKLDTRIKYLGAGQKQLVEIVKSLVCNPSILILDEPTSSLSGHEVQLLFRLINKLRLEFVTCIYISHKLEEIMTIADSVTILRDGHTMASVKARDTCKHEIIKYMIGRDMNEMYPRALHNRGSIGFEVTDYTVYNPTAPEMKQIDNVSFAAYSGEILGISGLVGAGRTELFSSIFGTYGDIKEGIVSIYGKEVHITSPADAIQNGYLLVSEDRKRYGLNLLMTIRENITLGSLDKVSVHTIINLNHEVQASNSYMQKLRIKAPNTETKTEQLSGGNQQKVVLAKSLMMEPKVLVLDEPTRGIDVGAKYEIYKIMNDLVDEGVIVIMISSEMEEIMGMSDHIVVIHEGRVTADMDFQDATQERLLRALMGES